MFRPPSRAARSSERSINHLGRYVAGFRHVRPFSLYSEVVAMTACLRHGDYLTRFFVERFAVDLAADLVGLRVGALAFVDRLAVAFRVAISFGS